MWIELIGLPGVGKTTLIKNNLSMVDKDYNVIRSDNPDFFQKVVAKILFYCHYSFYFKDKRLAKKLAYRHGFRFGKNRKQNILFYDSGMLQTILENLIETNFEDMNEKLESLRKIPLADKIIYIRDDIQDIAARETNRPKSRFQLDMSETITRYKTAERVIEKQLLQTARIVDTIAPNNPSEFIKALKSEKTF